MREWRGTCSSQRWNRSDEIMCTPCAQLPAPRLITGTGSICARYSATSEVVTSQRIEKQPASTKAFASSTSSFARCAVLPWATKAFVDAGCFSILCEVTTSEVAEYLAQIL